MANNTIPETWRPVTNWPYEVSNQGRIRPLNPSRNNPTRRPIKHEIDKDGFLVCTLSNSGLVRKFKVHRIVCESWHGPAKGREIIFSDGERQNVTPGNLSWGSLEEALKTRRRRRRDEAIQKNIEKFEELKLDPDKLDPVRTAYFAGIIDGEGYVGLMKAGYTRKDGLERREPTIQVQMTHEETVKAIHAYFGGGYYRREQRVTKNFKYAYRWEVRWKTAKEVAALILPYSITKREALEALLEHTLYQRGPKGRLSDEAVRNIRQRYAAGESWVSIAKDHGIGPEYAQQIGVRKWYKHVV